MLTPVSFRRHPVPTWPTSFVNNLFNCRLQTDSYGLLDDPIERPHRPGAWVHLASGCRVFARGATSAGFCANPGSDDGPETNDGFCALARGSGFASGQASDKPFAVSGGHGSRDQHHRPRT
jgi:hypothetical protein